MPPSTHASSATRVRARAPARARFYDKFLCVRRLPLPVVAAINGPAIGAGLCFAMACDVRVVSARARLGFTFVGLGLHPGMGATHLVASVAGYEVAYRLLLTGEVISGAEARSRVWPCPAW